jgi:hypothetical protein
MASTNKTTTLDLSQFVGTDKPDWLTDYNDDMEKIDTWATTADSDINAANNNASGAKTTAEAASQAANAATASAAQANTAVQNLLTSLNWVRGTISNPTAGVFQTTNFTCEYQPATGILNVYGSATFVTNPSASIPSSNYVSIGTINIPGMPNPGENKPIYLACSLTAIGAPMAVQAQSMRLTTSKSVEVYLGDAWPNPDSYTSKKIGVRFMVSTNQW